jgi:hypothetical protein
MLLVLVAAAAFASSLPVASLLAVALPKPLPQQEHADTPEHLRELQVGDDDDDTAADDDDTSNGPMDGSYGFCTTCPSVLSNIWGDDESGGGSDRAKCDAFLVCGNLEASDTCEATPGALRFGRRTHLPPPPPRPLPSPPSPSPPAPHLHPIPFLLLLLPLLHHLTSTLSHRMSPAGCLPPHTEVHLLLTPPARPPLRHRLRVVFHPRGVPAEVHL